MTIQTADKLIAAATEPLIKDALVNGVENLAASIMTEEQYTPEGAEDGPRDYNRAQVAALANGLSQFPVRLPMHSKTALPDAAIWIGALVFVTDAFGGAIPAFSDGSGWRRVDTNVTVT